MATKGPPFFSRLKPLQRRYRDALAPQRAELAAWYTALFRGRKKTTTTHLQMDVVCGQESPHPQWQFNWYPVARGVGRVFTPTTPVPAFVTAADAEAVGLPAAPGVPALRGYAFWDLAADAWADAGGFAFPQHLMISAWAFERADGPRKWHAAMRADLSNLVKPPPRERRGLGPPVSLGLPAADAGLLDAVRNGGDTALAAWADAADRAGATDAAELLRWLPRLHAMIDADVRRVAPREGFSLSVNRNGFTWWWIGDTASEGENDDERRLDRLLSAWNETHPAVEWLFRRLGLPHATLEATFHATEEALRPHRYNLRAGEHFEPLTPELRVLRLSVKPWEGAGR